MNDHKGRKISQESFHEILDSGGSGDLDLSSSNNRINGSTAIDLFKS